MWNTKAKPLSCSTPFSALLPCTGPRRAAAQTLVISLEIFLLQLDLSLGVRNQAFSLGVGLCGSMAGLFLMFMPQWPLLRLLTPWGHFGATMFVGNMWSAETPVISLYYMPVDWVGCFMALVGLVLFAVVGRTLLARKEV